MNMNPRHDFKPCVPGAFRGGIARTEFFDGMVLTEADMKREQSYWQLKRRLTNRALGQGVVWGLGVEWDAKGRCFTVRPGYGLSCCGDDLVVECPECIRECDIIDVCSEDFRKLLAKRGDPCNCDPPDGPVDACLLLEYVECPEDPRQVYEDPCAEHPRGCRYGAVRETVRLRLVPPPPCPPPGPIDRFCARIEEIRKSLPANVQMPDMSSAAGPRVSLSLSAFAADRTALGGHATTLVSEKGDTAQVIQPISAGGTDDTVRYGIEPGPGYVFASASRNGAPLPVGDIMMGVMRSEKVEDFKKGITAEIVVQMVPLFGSGPVRMVHYQLKGNVDNVGFVLKAEVVAIEDSERRRDCLSLLTESLCEGADWSCKLRTLVLAVLCGWFRGQLGTPECGDGPEPKPEIVAAQSAVAWLVCWLAWQLLFRIDISKDQAAKVENCLRMLFEEWCCGFHYKGPSCKCNVHGIVLGAMKISPRGKVICFDEWAYRRYVLTGPLITHWGAQFGLPPLDVSATRLASWICCIAKAPMPHRAEFMAGDALSTFLPVGGAAIGLGEGFANAATWRGLTVEDRGSIGPMEFVGRVLQRLLVDDGDQIATATAVGRRRVNGLGINLLEPSSFSFSPQPPQGNLHQFFMTELMAAPIAARAPIADFAEKLAASIPLAKLKTAADTPVVEPLVKALDQAGISTAADLLAIGSEPALARVRDVEALSDKVASARAMALVFGAAAGSVKDGTTAAAAAAAKRAADDPFIRADLADAATLGAIRSAVNGHIAGRGMTAAEFREIAGRTIDSGVDHGRAAGRRR